jgi:hypothetical protein
MSNTEPGVDASGKDLGHGVVDLVEAATAMVA